MVLMFVMLNLEMVIKGGGGRGGIGFGPLQFCGLLIACLSNWPCWTMHTVRNVDIFLLFTNIPASLKRSQSACEFASSALCHFMLLSMNIYSILFPLELQLGLINISPPFQPPPPPCCLNDSFRCTHLHEDIFISSIKSPVQVQLLNSEDVMASQLSADLSQYDPAVSAQLQNSLSLLQSLAHSQNSSAGGGEAVQEFESLRQNLLEQQQKELEELFIQQRREQMQLQGEIEEHHKRMKVGDGLMSWF